MMKTRWITSWEFLLFGAHSIELSDRGRTVAHTQKLRISRQMPVTANTLLSTKNLQTNHRCTLSSERTSRNQRITKSTRRSLAAGT